MEITDYNTDTLNENSELKALLVRAVNAADGHTDKTIWLTAVLTEAQIACSTPSLVPVGEWEQDDKSNSSIPGVKALCSRKLSENFSKSVVVRIALAGVFTRALDFL